MADVVDRAERRFTAELARGDVVDLREQQREGACRGRAPPMSVSTGAS
ncbi:hypothetical protein ACGFNV_18125 [Streptomyces sp. NPDC048751]